MIPRKPVNPLRVQTAVDHAVEPPLAPSQPAPAEHPSAPSTPKSHSSRPSKDESSPRKRAHTRQQSAVKPIPLRGKSASLSFPTHPQPDTPQTLPTQAAHSIDRLTASKKAAVPPPNEPTFLTALAAQERHVLELKEELVKAEENLTKLKKQWVAHEARKRQIEARGIHRMTSTTTKPPGLNGSADPTSVGSMYKDMAEKKATLDSHRGGPRRRYFSGSRHIRSLSLVSPDTLRRYADTSKPMAQTAKRNTELFDGHTDSPTFMPPTPDLIKEEEEDTEPSTNSQRSSRSPQRERMVRSSVQMASEFREGLWTFFEDLKHATYGDDARSGGVPQHRQGRPEAPRTAPLRQLSPAPSPARSPVVRPAKHTVRRQTWQIRPNEAYNDAKSPLWHDRGGSENNKHLLAEPTDGLKLPSSTPLTSTPFPEPPLASTLEASTPQKVVLHEREVDGEKWQTWDTPTSRGSPARSNSISSIRQVNGVNGHKDGDGDSPTMPTVSPPTSNSSLDVTPRPTPQPDAPRDSIPWPALNKLRPGHLRKTASHLMDEWEKSLLEPKQPRQTGLRPPHQTASPVLGSAAPNLRSLSPNSRSASPRPQSARRANSRLDVTYS